MAATPSVEPDPEQSAAANWFPLELPGPSPSLRLNPDLVDRLEREVIDSFKSLSKRGSEVGGILLGQVASNPRTIFIEDYELVPCAYIRGPLYLLSDVEKRRLEAAIRNRKNRDPRLVPVGFLRSNTRTALAPDDEDVSILNTYFSGPNSVLLLIKPFSMKPCLAGCFAWGDGDFDRAPDSLQFTFRRSELPAKRGPVPALRRVETVLPLPVVLREETRPSVPPARMEAPAPPAAVVMAPPEPPTPEPVESMAERLPDPPAIVWEPPVAPIEPPPPATLSEVEESQPVAPVLAPEPATPPVAPLVAELSEAVVESAPPPSPAAGISELASAEVPVESRLAAEPVPEVVPAASPLLDARTQEMVEFRALFHPTPPPAQEVAPVPVAQAPAKAQRPRPAFDLLRWLEFLAAMILGIVLGSYLQHTLEGKHPEWKADTPAGSSLSLKVERNAGQLYLSWDRTALPILTAQKAALAITDGDQRQVLPLTLEELRTGSFVFSPSSNDTSFQVDLSGFPDGRSVSESIRAVWGRPSALGSPALPAPLPVSAEVRPATPPPPVVSSNAPAAVAPAEPAAESPSGAKEEAEAQTAPPQPAADSPTP
jgi:hypothetical protein